jgi:Sel1 repeat-containing protein
MAYTDVAETKRKAEAGDTAAQLSLANTLAGQHRPADALPWYQKAAAQGSLEAVYRLGSVLLSGAAGIPSEKSVKAEPGTGIQLIFCAATNRYTAAYYDMHRAYRDGIGVPKDIVQAYAWLQLDVDSTRGPLTASVRHAELNRLALDVDVSTSQAGKRLAALYKAGRWPRLTLLPAASAPPASTPAAATNAAPPGPTGSQPALAPGSDPSLKLGGVMFGTTRLSIINGKTVGEGETATVALKAKPVTFTCIKIGTNFVLVKLEGEETLRRLSLSSTNARPSRAVQNSAK